MQSHIAVEFVKSIHDETIKPLIELVNQSLTILTFMNFTRAPKVNISYGSFDLMDAEQRSRIFGSYAAGISTMLSSGTLTAETALYFSKMLFADFPVKSKEDFIESMQEMITEVGSHVGQQLFEGGDLGADILLTREEYYSRQRGLAKSLARAEYRQAVLMRRVHREFYTAFIVAVSRGENSEIDKQALAQRIEAIIRTESVKPAEEAATLQAEREASFLGEESARAMRVHQENAIPKHTDAEWQQMSVAYRDKKITAEEWFAFEREYYAGREPGTGRQSFRPVKRPSRSWGVKASSTQGISSYHRDPETGKII